MKLEGECLRAVKYYSGDVSGDDPFWGDPKAYNTLNSLFFPGIRTEEARAAEGKRLNPAMLSDYGRLTAVACRLLEASVLCARDEEKRAYRVERCRDFYDCVIEGGSISFTSTSTAGFLPAYRDRRGIALLTFTIAAGVPCIPMEQALDIYAKSSEQEILLPPWVRYRLTYRPLSREEELITDADGKPPVLAADIRVEGWDIRAAGKASGTDGLATRADGLDIGVSDIDIGTDSLTGEALDQELLEQAAEAGRRVYEALNEGREPDDDDILGYMYFKDVFAEDMKAFAGRLKNRQPHEAEHGRTQT